jgi:tetratricopeptide (TPR) repeat protein
MGPVWAFGLREDRPIIQTPPVASAKQPKQQKARRTAGRRTSAAVPAAATVSTAAAAHSPSAVDPGLVERYHAMAEELNGRGAMELAVPFYRQAIALLLAEREQLRASADVRGVLEAAAQLEADSSMVANSLGEGELQRRVAALEEELCPANIREVAAALEALEAQWPQAHPQVLALRAKLHLLEGELAEAHACFEQAHALDGTCPRLRMNTGAARLALGDAAAALELLRPLAGELEVLARYGAVTSLWNNLAQAEFQAGDPDGALACLRALLDLDPAVVDLELWLEQANIWIASGQTSAAKTFLQLLRPQLSTDQLTLLLPPLAERLEAEGAYREAALLYRELLRPSL